MALTAKKVYAILKRQISDMEAKLNSPVRYRGTVATADLLPLNPDIGDMYNIESKSVYGEAGMNVAWNGVVWDTMGAPIDMSLYLTKEEAETVMQRLVTEYFEKNPVKPGATEEQAQQIKKNTNDVASLKEDLSTKITKFYASNQGETHITDSDNGKIQDMMIYGKSSQDGTPTPENPVEIKSVVNPTVKVSNEDGTKSQTVTLPYTLNAIPVSSGGNVTIDGQQYIADYVDVERGKLVRMCKEYVITGSERLAMYWLGNASYLRNVCCINNFENIVLYDGINPLAMSDMFIGKISENADDERAIYLILRGSGDKTLAIKFLDSDGITTVDLAKQWLIEHKPKTVFVLSTPEEIDLTSEEVQAFKALATYYPVTNIFINSEQLDGYTVFNYPISMANIITSLETKTENLESANYTDRGTLADTDAFLINDGTGMKKSVLSKLSDFVLNKIADKVFAKLQTNDKTILGAINELNSKTTLKTYQGSDISSYFGRIYISKNLGLSRPSSIIIFGYEGMGIALFESMYVNSLPKQAVNIYGNILTQTDDKTVLVNFSDRNRQVTIISPQGIEIEVASVE